MASVAYGKTLLLSGFDGVEWNLVIYRLLAGRDTPAKQARIKL